MIAAIRITGQVGLNKKVKETLFRLRLRRKYSCIVLKDANEVQKAMLSSVRNFISYGELSEGTYKKLVDARGKKDLNGKLKPFFRLHPPRKGINSKIHYPLGVLGENKEIDKLILRML